MSKFNKIAMKHYRHCSAVNKISEFDSELFSLLNA